MYRWFYEGSPAVKYGLLAMILFLGAFIAVVIRTLTSRHDEVSRLPLDDQEGQEGHEGDHHG